MNATFQVNEGSSAYLTVSLFDKLDAPAIPGTLTYSVFDLESSSELRASTALTPAAVVEIALTPADTAIVDTARAFERRRVTVVASYGPEDALRTQFDFLVRNLTRVS